MTFNATLNKYFEIIGLLHVLKHPEEIEKELWEQTAVEMGFNGKELYKQFGSLHKKYVLAFQNALEPKGAVALQKTLKQKDAAGFDFFFSEAGGDDEFIILLQLVCANHPQWFEPGCSGETDITLKSNRAAVYSEEEIVLAFVNEIAEQPLVAVPPTLELIALLNDSGYSAGVCWKVLSLLQAPCEKIEQLARIIELSLPAYEKAILTIEKPLKKLIAEFPQGKYISLTIQEQAVLTPVLIYPAVEMISPNSCQGYIGLFAKDIYKMLDTQKVSRKNLLPILKALSDSSKFDILLSLQTSPKYNLELAEALNLSAPTISHHMGVLLTYQLVNVEKRDGRVYYTLAKQTLEELLDELRSTFSLRN